MAPGKPPGSDSTGPRKPGQRFYQPQETRAAILPAPGSPGSDSRTPGQRREAKPAPTGSHRKQNQPTQEVPGKDFPGRWFLG